MVSYRLSRDVSKAVLISCSEMPTALMLKYAWGNLLFVKETSKLYTHTK